MPVGRLRFCWLRFEQTNWRNVYTQAEQEQRENCGIDVWNEFIAGNLRLFIERLDVIQFFRSSQLPEQIEWRDQQQREDDGASSRCENRRNEGRNQIPHGSDWVSQTAPRNPFLCCAQLLENRYSIPVCFSTLFLCSRSVRETRNRNLIDNMHKKLAQTNKKINDVERKCTEAAKQCLEVQLETVSDLGWSLLHVIYRRPGPLGLLGVEKFAVTWKMFHWMEFQRLTSTKSHNDKFAFLSFAISTPPTLGSSCSTRQLHHRRQTKSDTNWEWSNQSSSEASPL